MVSYVKQKHRPYLCTSPWSPHSQSLVPQARSWSPHIWTRPWKKQKTLCIITIIQSRDVLIHNNGVVCGSDPFRQVKQCNRMPQTPMRGGSCASPQLLKRYPLGIQDKGNYFCPAGPDYCVWPQKRKTSILIRSDQPEQDTGSCMSFSLYC